MSRTEPDDGGNGSVLDLLAAERRRADELTATVAMLREQLEARNRSEEELRALLLHQSEQLARLLAAPRNEQAAASETSASPPSGGWWSEFRERKRGLGASLTLTGITAILAGVILHFALQHRVIESAIHLGYIIGLVGLLSLLLGLLLVF